MLHVVTLLWEPNAKSFDFSRCYDETWVEKLYRGFRRNLTRPFRFVCFTDKTRKFKEPIEQEQLTDPTPGYGSVIEPFKLNEPMILVGLDTVIVGNLDHMADYCMKADKVALPRDPGRGKSYRACNGVSLVPAGQRYIYTSHHGENDMEWMRLQPHVFIDDIFPGQVLSYKCHVMKRNWPRDARIIYFHGRLKPHELGNVQWVRENWK